MLLEENHLTMIGFVMIIIGIVILVIPLLYIKRPEEHKVSLFFVYQIGELVINSRILIITGLLWIICGFVIQMVPYI
jgi:uncharacterized membrane protein